MKTEPAQTPSFSELMSRVAYGRSGDVNDPKNANADWRAGYAEGRYADNESFGAISQEWRERGQPNGKKDNAFLEWKIGFWAGRFARIDDGKKSKQP